MFFSLKFFLSVIKRKLMITIQSILNKLFCFNSSLFIFTIFSYRLGKNEQWKITKYNRSITNKCQFFFVFGANYSNQINCKHVDTVWYIAIYICTCYKNCNFSNTTYWRIKKKLVMLLVYFKSAYKYLLT